MDNFKIIYHILHYLEKAMDYDEVDMERISAATLKLSEQRWTIIMEMLITEGYINGMNVKRTFDDDVILSVSNPRITLKGLEYLQENSLMKKAADIAKGIADCIP